MVAAKATNSEWNPVQEANHLIIVKERLPNTFQATMERCQNIMASLNKPQKQLVISLVLICFQMPCLAKGIQQIGAPHILVPCLHRSATTCQCAKVVVGVLATILGKLL